MDDIIPSSPACVLEWMDVHHCYGPSQIVWWLGLIISAHVDPTQPSSDRFDTYWKHIFLSAYASSAQLEKVKDLFWTWSQALEQFRYLIILELGQHIQSQEQGAQLHLLQGTIYKCCFGRGCVLHKMDFHAHRFTNWLYTTLDPFDKALNLFPLSFLDDLLSGSCWCKQMCS